MRFKGFLYGIGMSSIAVLLSLSLTNCTCKISEQDYNKLQDLRKEEKTLISEISKKKDEKSSVDRELKARQGELNKCKEDMDFVQKKLSQWPNVWPDYVPPTQ